MVHRFCPRCGRDARLDERFCAACGTPLTPDPPRAPPAAGPDDLLLARVREALRGRYEAVTPIDLDGSGVVCEAVDVRHRRDVVLRVLEPAPRDADATRRVLARVRELTRLDHRNVVRVYDAFEADGLLVVVLQDVRGRPLDRLLADGWTPSIGEACLILGDVAGALQHAHDHGIVHRTLTPGHVLVDREGRAFVTGFPLDPGDAAELPFVTRTGMAEGTPTYLSPEQVRGVALDGRSDQYALGVIAYEMLTGTPLFAGTMLDVLQGHLERAPVPLRELRPDIPPPIAEMVERMLAKRADDRWPTLRPVLELGEVVVPGVRAPATGSGPRMIDLGATRGPARIAPPAPTPAPPTPPTPPLDENVQFTVYRPRVVAPDRWHTLLAFAHLAERRPDAPPDEPDPAAEVERQARSVLGDVAAFQQATQDSRAAVPRAGELVLVPVVEGVEFNPPSRAFRWTESVHREEFRLRAGAALDGRTARGTLTVFLGSIILAEVPLALRVDARAAAAEPAAPPTERSQASPYRKIFASYSHRDTAIVEQFELYARALGDDYLRDVTRLRAGEVWTAELERMIADADVFQLFWSSHSMRSPFVRREWECALALRRPSYVRPLYWEEPLPCLPAEGLPPEELSRLHFQRVPVVAAGGGSRSAPTIARPPRVHLQYDVPEPPVRPDASEPAPDLGPLRSGRKIVVRRELDVDPPAPSFPPAPAGAPAPRSLPPSPASAPAGPPPMPPMPSVPSLPPMSSDPSAPQRLPQAGVPAPRASSPASPSGWRLPLVAALVVLLAVVLWLALR